MLITDITPQKKKKDRVNIFIDGNFAFSLDLETLVKNNLTVNQELSEDKIERLIKEGELVKFYNKAVKFISFRPRSEKEVVSYLIRKKAGEKEILMVIKKLKSLELIDDSKFINWWFEQRQTFKPRSLREIKMEMLKKGVNKELICEVIDNKEADIEIKMARKLAQKVSRRYQNLSKKEFFQRMAKYLMQRGFNWETTKKIIDEIIKKE